MLQIDKSGSVINDLVKLEIRPNIEHAAMTKVNGIIVHQTGGSTAQSSLSSYKNAGANGAHFLIDKDGQIYQTASVYKQTWHVGKLQSRCMVELTCSAEEKSLMPNSIPVRKTSGKWQSPFLSATLPTATA